MPVPEADDEALLLQMPASEDGPDGQSYSSSVTQRATQVILFHRGEEIARQPIRLDPGAPNVIER